jgi:hypothetical protein
MLDGWALAVAILAFVVSGAALVIAWWQLVLQRDAAGGRGIGFTVGRGYRTVSPKGGVEMLIEDHYVEVELVGNDRHVVGVHLERDGRRLSPTEAGWVPSPPVRQRMTCESDPIVWHFDLDPDAARDLWVVLTWVSPFGDGIRTDALRRRLEVLEPDLERWHWFRSYRARRWLESWGSGLRWKWMRRWLGKPRRLGAWRPYGRRELQPGQSPMDSQVASGGRAD